MTDVQANLPEGQVSEFYEASWRVTKAVQDKDFEAGCAALADMMRLYHELKGVAHGNH